MVIKQKQQQKRQEQQHLCKFYFDINAATLKISETQRGRANARMFGRLDVRTHGRADGDRAELVVLSRLQVQADGRTDSRTET